MSLEQIGYGAGGGILSGIFSGFLIALGIRERVKTLEENKLDRNEFNQFQRGLDTRLQNIEGMLKSLLHINGLER